MACFSRTELLAELERYKTLKLNLEDALSGLFSSPVNGIKKYRYDSGVASQMAERFGTKELQEQILFVDAKIKSICDKLGLKDVTAINLKRRSTVTGGGL